jgi:hypothetical protein
MKYKIKSFPQRHFMTSGVMADPNSKKTRKNKKIIDTLQPITPHDLRASGERSPQ